MSAQVSIAYDEQNNSMDANGNYLYCERIYIVSNVNGEDAALAAVLESAPAVLHSIALTNAEITDKINDTTYRVTCRYKANRNASKSTDDDPTVSFNCSAGTKRMLHSYNQTRLYGNLDAGGAIGWNGKTGNNMSISGVSVPTANVCETYTKVFPLSHFTTAYKRIVAGLVGKINSLPFKGWNTGEVMFLGISYACPDKSYTKVRVSYHFAIRLNESNIVFAGQNVAKTGFQHLWAISSAHVVNGVPKLTVESIYVDDVCLPADFSVLGI